jgi:hypothetical protein
VLSSKGHSLPPHSVFLSLHLLPRVGERTCLDGEGRKKRNRMSEGFLIGCGRVRFGKTGRMRVMEIEKLR